MQSKNRAFTLTEILIAMSIFSLIVIGALALFDGAQKSMGALEKQSMKLRQMQLAMRQIEDDITHLVYRERRNEYGDKVALLRGESTSATSYLEFTRANWRNPAKLQRSNLQHIVYQFEDETIIRNHWLYLDNALEEQQLARPILTNIESMKVEFLDEEEWQDKWQVELENLQDLPRAIKITLHFKDPSIGKIYRVFPLVDFGKQKEADEQRK